MAKKPKPASVMPPTQAGARKKAKQAAVEGSAAHTAGSTPQPSARSEVQIRDRIKELRRVKASELQANPKNWRTHGETQRDAMRSILVDVGYADALLARETDEGLLLIDGHLRADLTPDQVVPVLIVDVTEEEADKLLLSLDPLAAMAGTDATKLSELLDSVDVENDELKAMLEGLAAEPDAESGTTEIRQLEVKPPPRMTWCLIGLPTVRWGEVAEAIEQLAGTPGCVCEVTSNDMGASNGDEEG